MWEVIITSSQPLVPQPRYQSFAELLFTPQPDEAPDAVLLMGTLAQQACNVSLGQLRSVVLELIKTFKKAHLTPGDTVCLIRLPRTSELTVAVTYAALSCAGLRVLLPMYPEPADLVAWLQATNSKAIFWDSKELQHYGHESDKQSFENLCKAAKASSIHPLCLTNDLELPNHLTKPLKNYSVFTKFVQASNLDSECLILTTSGSSGHSKLVRYTQAAFLRSASAWESAGLFSKDKQGGRALCLLFAHSMGIRSFWNAIWTRQSFCLIPPEWYLEHPERVRSLLINMQPEHVTGGPAVYRTLLELSRIFPDLKDSCFKHLHTAVSSGATFDNNLACKLKDTLGVHLVNAFGMTETLQVLSGLVDGPFTAGLGNLLPGVALKLEPLEDTPYHRLQIHSPFACSGYISLGLNNASYPLDSSGWFQTGDVIKKAPEGLHYIGREQLDFLKDGFGVKLPRSLLLSHYHELDQAITNLEFFPLKESPRLAALIFVKPLAFGYEECISSAGASKNNQLLNHIRSLLEARHEQLLSQLDDFELRHHTIRRFACVYANAPLTAKGNLAQAEIKRKFNTIIKYLTESDLKRDDIFELDFEALQKPAVTRLVRPKQGELLSLAKLDKQYETGYGDYLYYKERDKKHRVVDFVGGFGSNLLGHRHPDLVEAAKQFVNSEKVFLNDQGSARLHEGELAKLLSSKLRSLTAKPFIVRFGSTGAEVVEMALAHAWLEQRKRIQKFVDYQGQAFISEQPTIVTQLRRSAEQFIKEPPVILAFEGSFHGHSLGARSITFRARKKTTFDSLMNLECIFLPLDRDFKLSDLLARYEQKLLALSWDGQQIKQHKKSFSRIIAAIAEPIRGEGGIKEIPLNLLEQLNLQTFPLILDEIQSGLGRSGSFLASEGISASYYLFAKSLGGGIAKISALLIEKHRYQDRFDSDYVGTFSGDAFSATIATKVLEVIEQDNIPKRAKERGEVLRVKLGALQQTYPDIIAAVSGRGLMLGISFEPSLGTESFLLRLLFDRERMGLFAAAFLLNNWGVRVLPSLSALNSLRIEPSAYVEDEAIELLIKSLEDFCVGLRQRDFARLVAFLLTDKSESKEAKDKALPVLIPRVETPAQNTLQVAFLYHFVHLEQEVVFCEPNLARLSPNARQELFYKLMALFEYRASILFARHLFDKKVWFASMPLLIDAAGLEKMHKTNQRTLIIQRIQEALDYCVEMGCRVVSLGAYISILSKNGIALRVPKGLQLSSGNTFTVALGIRRIHRLCKKRGLFPEASTTQLAIVGAGGNIGSALAFMAAEGSNAFRKICLLGRDKNRLETLKLRLKEATEGIKVLPEISISTDLKSLQNCNVILLATNTTDTLIYPHHLAQKGPTIIADLSVPTVVAPLVRTLAHVRVVPLVGTVAVPGSDDFAMASHIPQGRAFACAAEAMLLGLNFEETRNMQLIGEIQSKNVKKLDALAERYGFYDTLKVG